MLNENTNSYNIEFIRSQFPALNVRVWNKRLSYLDSAASMQKPKVVLDNIQENYSSSYSNVHRGLHYLSEKATESYENSRIKVANFINANENEIIFTSGATAAINLVAYSWGNQNLNKNDEIILTIAEHHANFVPWQYIAKSKGAKIKVVHYNPDEDFDLSKIKGLITNKTKLITFPHVSNVLGTVFPVKEICSLAKQVGAVTLVDGCQGAIHFKVDVKELGCDFYCFSG
ncbi:MAG: cysteine desulfurase, partial [SAR116 cluster bacterium]|nr:cysteine desulfurase [SAR116 cluster bacterium]